ncbi:hydroxyethylthiazole kinase [Actinomyces sp. ZJ308]|uniref:hydroxyethylthiazole kinase n=1 Tax=Actinomyces sp. ZJ308 TaxID=2708342 RepID=UPI00141EEE45|nr:hydroxyethylthiazole kinase [Actinomyces sp. ZJ308]
MHWDTSTPAALESLRRHAPLVSCITNSVVTNVTANVLLALGAVPAMVDITGEAGPFAQIASALLINLGTPQPEQRAAAREAVAAANDARTPWVLDPVAIGTLAHRTALAHELVVQGPSAVRGNASEIIALVGAGSGGRGVEATDDVDAALAPACDLARRHGCVVAVSGPVDLVTDGERVVRVRGGSALLTRMTGGGCALGAVTAAFLGAGRKEGLDSLSAVVAAHAVYSAAAERAAARSAGPGSFQPAFLDALYALETKDLGSVIVRTTGATDEESA